MAAVDVRPIREVMKVIQPIVDQAGARCWLESSNGPHARLYVEMNGRSMFTPLSTSPRTNGQAIKYKTSDVKRMLRELAA